MYRLTRLSITGPLDVNTPLVVLLELAHSHGVAYSSKQAQAPTFARQLLRDVSDESELPCIHEPPLEEEYGYLARFVNPGSRWSVTGLFRAYSVLRPFMTQRANHLALLPLNWEAGVPTDEVPERIGYSILYAIMKEARLETTLETSPETMIRAVRLLQAPLENLQAELLLPRQKSALVKMLLSVEATEAVEVKVQSRQKVTLDYETLKALHEKCSTAQVLQRCHQPQTDHGAIALAALGFHCLLTEALDPIEEYTRLKELASHPESVLKIYSPHDPFMSSWYKLNPKWFCLDYYYHPCLPERYYDKEMMLSILQFHGISPPATFQATEILGQLQQLILLTGFHLGPIPAPRSRKQPETIINLEAIDEVPDGCLLAYGTLAEPANIKYLSVEELTQWFQDREALINPFEVKEVLTNSSLHKLKHLLTLESGVTYLPFTEEVKAQRYQLYSLIEQYQARDKRLPQPFSDLVETYRRGNSEQQNLITQGLQALLTTVMYMRGWLGPPAPLPIREALTSDSENEIFARVTQGLVSYEQQRQTILFRCNFDLDRLPLLTYSNNVYNLINRTEEGLTVGGRLKLVREGKSTYSCIRLSSNPLCTTAYRALLLTSGAPTFNIASLRYIS